GTQSNGVTTKKFPETDKKTTQYQYNDALQAQQEQRIFPSSLCRCMNGGKRSGGKWRAGEQPKIDPDK
ncbi:MAG: hypothetical protein WAM72_11845, partial [Xanthobacteraceae bacterium]